MCHLELCHCWVQSKTLKHLGVSNCWESITKYVSELTEKDICGFDGFDIYICFAWLRFTKCNWYYKFALWVEGTDSTRLMRTHIKKTYLMRVWRSQQTFIVMTDVKEWNKAEFICRVSRLMILFRTAQSVNPAYHRADTIADDQTAQVGSILSKLASWLWIQNPTTSWPPGIF